MTMCTVVGNYFWLSTRRSSGAGRGDRQRGCVLMSRAGGAEKSYWGWQYGRVGGHGGGGSPCRRGSLFFMIFLHLNSVP
jgi:hypothetical protein